MLPNHMRALPRGVWSHFREGFRQTAIYDRELWNILILFPKCLTFLHLGQSRLEDPGLIMLIFIVIFCVTMVICYN